MRAPLHNTACFIFQTKFLQQQNCNRTENAGFHDET